MKASKYFEKMDREALMEFWCAYRENCVSKKDAERVVGKRSSAQALCWKLANLASNVAARKLCEQAGDRTGVDVYKIICDRILASLPYDLEFHSGEKN